MKPKHPPQPLYFDNAATTRRKPPAVYKAVADFAENLGVSNGRGAYRLGVEANALVFEARQALAQLLGIPRSDRLVFTKNATEAVNAALKGFLKSGDHVVVSGLEHNAVVRPLNRLKAERGIEWTSVTASESGRMNPYDFEAAILPKTKLVCLAHASNVLGTLAPAEEVGEICRRKGVAFLLDAAQTAGSVPIDVKKLNVDFLCVTGHKGLMGPTGTGALAVSPRFDPASLIEGGTGSNSDLEEQPGFWPDKFEAGTQNLWGLAGLRASAQFLLKQGVEAVRKKEEALTARFLEGIAGIPGLRAYGLPVGSKDRVAVVSLNLEGRDPAEVAYALDENWGVMVRAGLHCAPLAHKTLGTFPQGTVRFSFGYYNTESEIDKAVRALREVAKA